MEFKDWKECFVQNQHHFDGINIEDHDQLSADEREVISSSLQQFQKGESSEGRHLFAFAKEFGDPDYLECIKLFIREEQRHAAMLASFMKKFQIPLLKTHWVDQVFRWLRKTGGIQNTVNILLVAEVIAKVYYRALHHATESVLLKRICLQILNDEEAHIRFQSDLLQLCHTRQSRLTNFLIRNFQLFLMTGTALVVWWHHRRVLKAGGYYFGKYFFETLLVFFEAEQRIKGRKSHFRKKKLIAA